MSVLNWGVESESGVELFRVRVNITRVLLVVLVVLVKLVDKSDDDDNDDDSDDDDDETEEVVAGLLVIDPVGVPVFKRTTSKLKLPESVPVELGV